MIKIKLSSMDEISSFIKSLPRGMKIVGMRAASEYIVGDDDHGLKHYPRYKYVSPFRSYSSDPKKAARQRGWIFTHLNLIGKDNRTFQTRDAWQINESNGQWDRVSISNNSGGIAWTMSDKRTLQNQAAGWRLATDVVQSNMTGAIRHAQAEVNRAIAAKKL